MFYENYKKLCEENGETVNGVALKCGGTRSSANSWRKGAVPKSEMLSKIADHFNVSTDFLLSGKKETIPLSDLEKELLKVYRQLPEIEQQIMIDKCKEILDRILESKRKSVKFIHIPTAIVAAGGGISTPYTSNDEFADKLFPDEIVPINTTHAIPINGDSMEPNIPDGSIVFVEKTTNVNYGDVVIVTIDDSPYCKIYEKDGLHSYNDAYDTIPIHEDTTVELFGKVLGYYDKPISSTVFV